MEIFVMVVFWACLTLGAVAIACFLSWAGFKLLTYLLKSLGMWHKTIKIMALYFALKRHDNWFMYKGKVYEFKERK